jgi:D-alanyl-D-alanine carboxypeptidase (penicillin-binding protein 5/6)
MMTAYLLLDKVKNGQANMNDKVKVSDQGIVDLSHDEDWGTLDFNKGEDITVQQLYEMMMIPSSNESAQLLGRYIAGSDVNYMNLANQKAAEIGMSNTHFVNASGSDWDVLDYYKAISGTPHENNTSTANDLALLASRLITEFPEVITLTSRNDTNVTWRGNKYPTYVWNLPGQRYDNGLVKVEGIKTVYTLGAGNVYVNSAQENGHRLVSVIMHDTGSGNIGQDEEKLLKAGFEQVAENNASHHWQNNTAVLDIDIQDDNGNVVRTERIYIPVGSDNQKIGLTQILEQLGLDPNGYEMVDSTTDLVG